MSPSDLAHKGRLALVTALVIAAIGGPGSQSRAQGTVIESQGEAVYRVPLVVPPGPANHQPQLSLVY
jgi:hypothetical protein